MCSDIVFTAQEQSWDLCLDEVKMIPGCSFVKWLHPGVGIMKLPGEFQEASAIVRSARPIFIRHIFPLQAVVPVTGTDFTSSSLSEAVLRLFEAAGKNPVFSVQARVLDSENYAYTKYNIVQYLSTALQNSGGQLSVQAPDWVLSLVVSRNEAMIGLSKAADNLSDWAGGMRRYAKNESQISRAEFKLLEALETFALDLPKGGRALDLGAAPGGWSKVLLESGMDVVAVDPGRMGEQFGATCRTTSPGRMGEQFGASRFTHFKGLAQEYLKSDSPSVRKKFNLIVNDMRMDIPASARIMLDAAHTLIPGGTMIMTFKLPRVHKQAKKSIQTGLGILDQCYHITHVKQLFHNRSEITAAGRRRE